MNDSGSKVGAFEPTLTARRRTSLMMELPESLKGVLEGVKRAKKRRLVTMALLSSLISGLVIARDMLFYSKSFTLYLSAASTTAHFAGSFIIASNVRPEHKHRPIEIAYYIMLAVCAFVAFAFGIGVAPQIYTAMLYVINHWVYGSRSTQPATYIKWLAPPLYMMTLLFFAFTGGKFTVNAVTYALFVINFLYGIFIFVFVLSCDRPLEKNETSMVEIRNDGFYYTLYLYWTLGAAVYIAAGLHISVSQGPIVQSLALQCTSVLLLVFSQRVSIRATDPTRFAALMLIIYCATDTMQALLFIQEGSFTIDFFVMILIQEISSLFKNCGFIELFSWIIGTSKIMPYRSDKMITMLRSKALVDSISEILACISAFSILVVETEVLSWEDVVKFNVTLHDDDGHVESYVASICLSTCIGWNVDSRVPPPNHISSTIDIFILLCVILFIRIICLAAEVTLLSTIKNRFDDFEEQNSVGRSHGSRNLQSIHSREERKSPELGFPKKAFRELDEHELTLWLEKGGFQGYVDELIKVGPVLLASASDDDLVEIGLSLSLVRRQLLLSIKAAIDEGVELEFPSSGKLPMARSMTVSALSSSASQLSHSAAGVITHVPTTFLIVSFYFAFTSVCWGCQIMSWVSRDDSVEVHQL